MWLPLEWPVSRPGNGLVVARQSHAQHLQIVQNGTWTRLGSGLRGQLEILALYRQLGETSEHFSPSLAVGDVLIFSKCAVHSSSGDNSARASRHAWQIRSDWSTSMSRTLPRNCWRQLSYAIKNQLVASKNP